MMCSVKSTQPHGQSRKQKVENEFRIPILRRSEVGRKIYEFLILIC